MNAEIRSQAAASMMLAGLAVMAAAQPQSLVVQPAVVPVPSARPAAAPVSPSQAFGGNAPPVIRPPQTPRPSMPSPIVCSVTGDAQLATVLCH
jgi:hypothetical protein